MGFFFFIIFIISLSLKSPIGKICGPSFEKTLHVPVFQECLCKEHGRWYWTSGSGEKDENVESLLHVLWKQQTMDIFAIRKAHFSIRLRLAKKRCRNTVH